METGKCHANSQERLKEVGQNYRPISLLPLFGKIFENLIFNDLYSYLISNNLISDLQSGFNKGDSTVNQLLSIVEMIRTSFDCNQPKEVRGIFLDISKAFDKVWHEGLIFKLKVNGVEGKVIDILNDFLSNRSQRTSLNGKNITLASHYCRGSSRFRFRPFAISCLYQRFSC